MRLSLLEARERRQAVLSGLLGERKADAGATIFLSLNIPGAQKTPPGAAAFFAAMRARLLAALAPASVGAEGSDALGSYAIVRVGLDPVEAKRRCVDFETSEPCARLVDLDVYAADGVQVDRARLGLASRSCFVCSRPAVECIRAKRHDASDVITRVYELLSNFRA